MGRKTSTVRWCPSCDIPIIDRRTCPICGSAAEQVDLPPVDLRPAFPHDINEVKRLLREQYGCEEAPALDGCVAILHGNDTNAAGMSLVAHGRTLAVVRRDLTGRRTVRLTMDGALLLQDVITKSRVTVKKSALPYLNTGKNAMATSVIRTDPGIVPDDHVLVTIHDGTPVAIGDARMSGEDMVSSDRGMAVKVRDVRRRDPPAVRGSDWNTVVEANAEVIKRRVAKSVRFIREKVGSTGLPPEVSFSGGKDSLAVVLLMLDAGIDCPVSYLNTGLEFDETVEYVRFVADHYGLDLRMGEGSTELFFSNLERFGPPAVDFRWCCKTNKLGPLARLHGANFPDGCLSLIGQRMYESDSREGNGDTWENPWFPGSVNISPIQGWNSIHVWLYIFMRKAPYNPLYARGLSRIGCCMCPSAGRTFGDVTTTAMLPRWDEFIERYSERYDDPEAWRTCELWRWKSPSRWVVEEVTARYGRYPKRVPGSSDRLRMVVQPGYSPCVIGYSVECALSAAVDVGRLAGFAKALGKPVELDPDGDWVSSGMLTVYAEGSMVSKAPEEAEARRSLKAMFAMIVRSQECSGCGSCVPRCPEGALRMDGSVVEVDPDKCTGCGRCIGPCPSVKYQDE